MTLRSSGTKGKQAEFKDKEKPSQIRSSNITAAKGKIYISVLHRH